MLGKNLIFRLLLYLRQQDLFVLQGPQEEVGTFPSTRNWTQICTGQGVAFFCGIELTGQISCGGNFMDSIEFPRNGTFKSLACGTTFACGLRPDGGMSCWYVVVPLSGFFANRDVLVLFEQGRLSKLSFSLGCTD
jgi:hypothetical protein